MYKRCKELLEELESEGKIKVWWEYKFSSKEQLKLRLKDMLEKEVDEKYYLSDAQIENIKFSNFMQEKKRIQDKEYCDTILSRDFKDPKCVRIGGIFDTNKSRHQAGSIYDKEGISPTLDIMQGGWRQPSIITHNITQKVKVRLYPVDVEALKTTLRNAKLNVGLNNREIANSLQIPQTQVEHYFRTDNSFAIPSPEIYLKLKELLKIETDCFDESIMTFEEKDNEYDISNRVYNTEGIAPTQTIQNDAKILIKNATKQGYIEAEDGDSVNLAYPTSNTRRGRVGKEVSQTLTANDSMGIVLKYVGSIKDKDIVGDNKNLSRNSSIGDRVYDNNGLATTQSAVGGGKGGNTGLYTDGLRIRKLTPLEYWRLQGFDDEDFYKAKQRLNDTFYKGRDKSNSQLYKQAGNSITVNVLEKIFLKLF